MRYALYTIGILMAAIVVGVLLIDEGEVVTLVTRGGNGKTYETQLWVIEADSELFLRASSGRSDWLARLRARPEVELQRGEETHSYRARPLGDAAILARVNRAMAEKYGLSDRLLAKLVDPSSSVAVRLEPVPE